MAEEHSNHLVQRWRAGDEEAARQIFERYADRLVALARSRLPARLSARIDAEDVVQSACRCFFADAREGRYRVEQGGDLWRLLVTITLHKLNDQLKWNRSAKRAADRDRAYGSEDSLVGLGGDLSRPPSAQEALALADELEQVMGQIRPLERRVLELRLQGHNLDEIAATVECSERTVRRALEEVKRLLVSRSSSPRG